MPSEHARPSVSKCIRKFMRVSINGVHSVFGLMACRVCLSRCNTGSFDLNATAHTRTHIETDYCVETQTKKLYIWVLDDEPKIFYFGFPFSTVSTFPTMHTHTETEYYELSVAPLKRLFKYLLTHLTHVT